MYERTKSPYDGILLAVIADDLDEADTRDTALRSVVATKETSAEMRLYVDLAKLLQDAVAREKPQLDPAAVDALVERGKTGQPTCVWFAAGRYFANRDRHEDADRYLKLAATSPRWLEPTAIMAWKALRERDIEFGPRRFVEIPGRRHPCSRRGKAASIRGRS